MPPGFQPLAEVDLSTRPFAKDTLGIFTLAETAVVSIYCTLPNIDTTYFDLMLVGPQENSLLILHSEKYRADANGGGIWEQSLPPGEFRLVLTADQSPGVLSVHWGRR